MIPYMVGKLTPNSTYSTRGLVEYFPGRVYFRAVPPQNGDRIVTSPPPSIFERVENVVNEKGKLLLGFAEDNKLALLYTFFCVPQNGVSYTFQSANRSKEQAGLGYILTKLANRRLVRCVNVRQPALEAPELDHNLSYAKVCIL